MEARIKNPAMIVAGAMQALQALAKSRSRAACRPGAQRDLVTPLPKEQEMWYAGDPYINSPGFSGVKGECYEEKKSEEAVSGSRDGPIDGRSAREGGRCGDWHLLV